MFGPLGSFVESFRPPVHSHRQRAAGHDDFRDAFRRCHVEQTLRAANVDSLHLLQEFRPAADAHPERQVKERVDPGACRGQRLRILEMPVALADVEPLERGAFAFRQLEHAWTDSPLVQALRNVVAKETACAGHEYRLHRSSSLRVIVHSVFKYSSNAPARDWRIRSPIVFRSVIGSSPLVSGHKSAP